MRFHLRATACLFFLLSVSVVGIAAKLNEETSEPLHATTSGVAREPWAYTRKSSQRYQMHYRFKISNHYCDRQVLWPSLASYRNRYAH